MRLVVRYLDAIRALSYSLALVIEELVSRINTVFAAEHRTDGTHGAVTATSVAATGAVTGATLAVSGNVGIGTASPSGRLDVEGASVRVYVNASSGHPFVAIQMAGATIGGHGSSGAWLGDSSSHLSLAAESGRGVAFYTNGTTTRVMFVDENGNVGIGTGTSAPDTRLDIDAGAMEFAEMSEPAAGAANTARLYCKDNGAGKSQLCVRFATGAVQVLATEP